jgi:hypothetical protein
MGNIEDLTSALAADGPEPSDAWEVTAMIESSGFNDRWVKQEFGFENTHAAGQYMYDRLRGQVFAPTKALGKPGRRGPAQFAGNFFSSFVYSIPWLVILFFEWTKPQALDIAPDIAGPLSLALMGSLITSGGFIQVIARRGRFYLCLEEPSLARRMCLYFVRIGFLTASLLCLIAVMLGFYFSLFSTRGLLIAALYYLLFSFLWMVCAVLSIEGSAWRIPVVFLVGGAVFCVLNGVLGRSALTAQTAALSAMLGIAATLAAFRFRSELRQKTVKTQEMALPRIPVLVHSLTPYFFYGVAYFSFLFADRFAAGTAITLFSGLSFGIESGYARGIDFALVNFLFTAALVEALNYRFMGGWYDLAKAQSNAEASLSKVLRNRYASYVALIAGLFVTMSAATYFIVARLWPFPKTTVTVGTMWLGSLGYLFLVVALFNAVILFSVNRPRAVLPSILQGLLADFAVGYTLSHLLSAHFAVVGLVLGGMIFAYGSTRAVLRALEQPDYTYYAA